MKKAIIPGVLTESLDDLREKVKQASSFSERVCVDVIDGLFADNLTVMPSDLREVDWHDLSVDVQLMVEEPADYLGELHLLKVERVFGHVEKMGKPEQYLAECKELSLDLGWGFDLYTPLEALSNKLLLEAKAILLMSVKAGFSGQKFEKQVLNKIAALRKLGFMGDIVMDGGLNKKTIPLCLRAEANQFSVTSDLWDSDEPRLRYRELAGSLKDAYLNNLSQADRSF